MSSFGLSVSISGGRRKGFILLLRDSSLTLCTTENRVSMQTSIPHDLTPTQLRELLGEELYGEFTRSVVFTEFVVNRMQELGFDVPDDVPLHLSLDYHLVLLRLCVEEYIKKGWVLPTPENSGIQLKESMI